MFYEPGKTDHGLPYDPFKVDKKEYLSQILPFSLQISGLRNSSADRLDQHRLAEESWPRTQVQPRTVLAVQQPHI
jgi:hypothetical protein